MKKSYLSVLFLTLAQSAEELSLTLVCAFHHFHAAIMMDEEEYITADIPDEFKALRACLRCSLVKTFEQVRLVIFSSFQQCT